jgi:oligopeptide transport system substrate-binding protein
MKLRSLVPAVPAAFALLLLSPGCGHHETPVALGDRTQTLQLGNLTEPTDLDPQIVNSQQDFNIIIALLEGLAQYDTKTCLPVPGVAERWEASADNLTWTFHLRSTAKWSNGDPVTARDFVYAYHRILSPNLGAEYAYMLFALKNGEAFYQGKITDFAQVGAVAADDHTLVLHLAHPVPYLPNLVCHGAWYPLHQATIEKFGKMDQRGSAWTRPGNYVGNGPFVLAEWKPHQIIRVTKSPTYWNREHIKLNAVNFYPIEANDTEEAMFRTGQLHITSTMPIDKIAVYRNDPKLRVFFHPSPMLGTYFFRFNVTKPPLDNVKVRRALAYAINRKEMVERVTLGGQLPAGHLTPPDTAGFTARAEIPSDAARARQLLADAGYPGGKNFPHLELLYNTNEGHRKIAEALQQMWRHELGIDITLVNQEAKVQSDSMRDGNYQIARYAWIGDYLDPSTFLDIMTGDGGNNQTGWKNAEYDRLIAEANRTADQAKRFEIYQRCEQILADECPIAPLYFYVRDNLHRPSVQGWYGNLLDEHPFTDVYLDPSAEPR